ncbi:MAG: contractile injection system tape measure protein [Bacteroidia bacterium]
MSAAKHIIKRTVIELNVKGAENGFRAQTEISNYFKGKIVPVIERSLDEAESKGQIIRIDKLELNLKKYILNRDNDEALRLLEAEVKEKLAALIKKNTATTEYTTRAAVKKLPEENSAAELFFFLLKNGVLPWWTGSQERISFEALTRSLLEAPPANFKTELLQALRTEQVRQRLVQKLPPGVFRQLLALAAGSGGGLISAYEELSGCFSQMTSRQINRRLAEYALKSAGEPFTSRQQFISGFLQHIDHFPWIRELYHTITETHDATPLAEEIKQSLAISNRHYLGRIKRLFSEDDQQHYFKNESTLIANSSTETPDECITGKSSNPETVRPAEADPQGLSPDPEEAIRNTMDFHVANAGMVILAPYLPAFFKELCLLEGEAFKTADAAERAAHLLHYLVEGEHSSYEEHEMTLNKVLCGIDVYSPFTIKFGITETEAAECKKLLQAVAANWTALKGTSGEGMRDAFFRREGILERQANGWNLKIEKTTIDVLVDKLPWAISIVKLPWTEGMIFVNW